MNVLKVAAKAAQSPERTIVRVREDGILAVNRSAEAFLWSAGLTGRVLRKSLRMAVQPLAPKLRQLRYGNRFLAVLERSRTEHRRHLRPDLSRTEFFQEMNRRSARYVLLWWWQEFPEFPAGEEMDIFIDDDDIAGVDELFVDYPTGVTCDILGAKGTERWHHHGVPYFPPALAEALLSERRLYRGLVMVPSERTHFAALAYHSVFHKGARAGLPGFALPEIAPEHDYRGALRAAAQAANIVCEPSVTALTDWLRRNGFAPGCDTLTKLIDHRPELEMLAQPLACDRRGGELCVFVIRARAEQEGLSERFTKAILDRRIEILASLPIAPEVRADVAKRMRGGKWDRGPFPMSGGDPARLVIGYDYHPKPLTAAQARKHRWFTNRHVLEAKQASRKIIQRTRPFTRFYNGMHSADNEPEAVEYLAAALRDELPRIKTEVERRRQRFHTRYPVRKLLSEGRRAKVELIDFRGALAVKKTFRIGFERFLERELLAAGDLANELSFIPPLLEAGEGYLIVPYYEDVLQKSSKSTFWSMLREHRESVFKVIQEMYSRGLAYIDFKPRHIIITSEGHFLSIDYEFLQNYPTMPDNLDAAFEVAGVPEDFSGDLPIWARRENRSFDKIWKPFVGSWCELKQLYA